MEDPNVDRQRSPTQAMDDVHAGYETKYMQVDTNT